MRVKTTIGGAPIPDHLMVAAVVINVRRSFACLCVAALLLVAGSEPAYAQTVDEDVVIVANGNILTMNDDQPTASAMAVHEGKIIAVGDLEAVKEVAGQSYEYVDLEGRTVVRDSSRVMTTWCSTAPSSISWISRPSAVRL